MDLKISDMIMRELIPDEALDSMLKWWNDINKLTKINFLILNYAYLFISKYI